MPSRRRASPWEARISASRPSAESVIRDAPRPRVSSARARSSTAPRACAPRASSGITRHRESRGAMTLKDGFSVVAPMSVTVPASTWGSSASCWALLRRWISSMKSSVRSVVRRAASMALRISGTPAVTAESGTSRASARSPRIQARVVLPLPGGPQRRIDESVPWSTSARRGRPGASSVSCPTSSSRRRGRMRSARGACGSRRRSIFSGNRSSV